MFTNFLALILTYFLLANQIVGNLFEGGGLYGFCLQDKNKTYPHITFIIDTNWKIFYICWRDGKPVDWPDALIFSTESKQWIDGKGVRRQSKRLSPVIPPPIPP